MKWEIFNKMFWLAVVIFIVLMVYLIAIKPDIIVGGMK